jgi:hypothetical protein
LYLHTRNTFEVHIFPATQGRRENLVQDPNLFSSFLQSKGVHKGCEVCGGRQWSMAGVNAGLTMCLPVHQEKTDAKVMPMVTAYALVCQHCGNIRLHAMAVVDPGSVSQVKAPIAIGARK